MELVGSVWVELVGSVCGVSGECVELVGSVWS